MYDNTEITNVLQKVDRDLLGDERGRSSLHAGELMLQCRQRVTIVTLSEDICLSL